MSKPDQTNSLVVRALRTKQGEATDVSGFFRVERYFVPHHCCLPARQLLKMVCRHKRF